MHLVTKIIKVSQQKSHQSHYLLGTGICSHSVQLTFLTCILRIFLSPLQPINVIPVYKSRQNIVMEYCSETLTVQKENSRKNE